MPILPIDTGRYGTPEMLRIFEEENRLQRMLDVEAALAWAQAEVGLIPQADAEVIMGKASVKYVKPSRVKEIEGIIQHDVMAVVRALAEASGKSGGYVHLGATSNDVNDTATALQFKEALTLIQDKLIRLEGVLLEASRKYAKTIMVGRTHGQHALPITLGLKFAVWMMEVSRHLERLMECRRRVLVGKMTGAVGTQAGMGARGVEIQHLVMERLGLKPVEVSTQIIQRDRYGELICLFALIASTLEKFATEIRELQRPEIGELQEAFDVESQVGSSTMPHKVNPIFSERVCGLAKTVRGLVIPALENIPTWHERDLTQSSSERIIIPTAFILLDYMLALMVRILSTLRVNEERMRQNMELTQGRFMSEALMLALTRKGMDRQEAHELVRKLAMNSLVENKSFKEVLVKDPNVRRYMREEEVEDALNPENYLGTTLEQIERAVKTAESQMTRLSSSMP
ncbi:MAG: adenylosuccinate lyase [Candidatus Bathyarchaeia archaeon]